MEATTTVMQKKWNFGIMKSSDHRGDFTPMVPSSYAGDFLRPPDCMQILVPPTTAEILKQPGKVHQRWHEILPQTCGNKNIFGLMAPVYHQKKGPPEDYEGLTKGGVG